MIQKSNKVINLAMFLVLCTTLSSSIQADSLSVIQKKELTLFGLKALGMNVTISDVKKVLSNSEVNKMVSTGINLNGHLCAELVEINPLKLKKRYEVTCIAYGGGRAMKSYIIDAFTGVAFIP